MYTLRASTSKNEILYRIDVTSLDDVLKLTLPTHGLSPWVGHPVHRRRELKLSVSGLPEQSRTNVTDPLRARVIFR